MENEGWEVDELAREAGLSARQLRRWVSSESDIRLDDIRKMSDKFRRPMSVLFMAEAPATAIPPQYRRVCGGGQARPRMSRDMLDVIREARFVQDNAAELLHEMGKSACPDVRTAAVDQSPEVEASRSAKMLDIEPPRGTEGGGDAEEKRCDSIREKIESRNIFALQDAIPAKDGASGFALVDPRPAVVLADSNDPVRRRIFALLHEYAHVPLGADGVCGAGTDPGGAGGRLPRVEVWCDRFAGAMLMPGEKFRAALDEGAGLPATAIPFGWRPPCRTGFAWTGARPWRAPRKCSTAASSSRCIPCAMGGWIGRRRRLMRRAEGAAARQAARRRQRCAWPAGGAGMRAWCRMRKSRGS